MRRRTRRRQIDRRRRSLRRQKGGADAAAPPTAVMIEPRQKRSVPFVLRNFAENLPPEWNILVLHGTDNEAWLKEKLAGELAPFASRIELQSLGVKNLTIPEHSKLLQTPEFYEKYIPSETFIIFQADSMICAPHKGLLQKFLDYDYVGAPWAHGWVPGVLVGNGGLSLRKKSKMLEKLRKCPPVDPGASEDYYFSKQCEQAPLKIPDAAAAREFSIEEIYNPKSWGIHKAWAWDPWQKADAMEAQCPGIKELQSLQ